MAKSQVTEIPVFDKKIPGIHCSGQLGQNHKKIPKETMDLFHRLGHSQPTLHFVVVHVPRTSVVHSPSALAVHSPCAVHTRTTHRTTVSQQNKRRRRGASHCVRACARAVLVLLEWLVPLAFRSLR